MTKKGTYQTHNKAGEKVVYYGVRFESTGKTYCDKIVWRKIAKDGTPTNIFAEQCTANLPWVSGAFFYRLSRKETEQILEQHPELYIA